MVLVYKKGSTHWSKQNDDCVSKSLVFLFYKLICSDEQGKWVYNLMNRQKKFVLINCHCLYVLKQTQLSSFQRADVAQKYMEREPADRAFIILSPRRYPLLSYCSLCSKVHSAYDHCLDSLKKKHNLLLFKRTEVLYTTPTGREVFKREAPLSNQEVMIKSESVNLNPYYR